MKKASLIFIMASQFACAAHAEVFSVAPHALAAIGSPFAGEGRAAELNASTDNDGAYRPGYRQGGVWKTAWDVPTVAWWWLMVRQNDLLSPVTTGELRLATTDGSGYRAAAIEPIAAEPEEWSMMLVGAGLVALQIRRKQKRG